MQTVGNKGFDEETVMLGDEQRWEREYVMYEIT